MIMGSTGTPAALPHLIAVIHSSQLPIYFQLDFSHILTNALDDWLAPTANPDLSML